MTATSTAPPTSVPSEPPVRLAGHPLQIRGWKQLQEHLARDDKRESYRKLLADIGIDSSDSAVRGLIGRPSLLYAEQPGCWFTPRDLVRANLLDRLIRRANFDPEISGVRTLAHDRFTAIGDKGVFLDFALHPRLGPARLLGSQFVKKHEHRTYASLQFTSNAYQRMRTIWDYSLRLIEAASESPARFAKVATAIFDDGPLQGARDILPVSNDPAELLEIGKDVAGCRLEPAFQSLWPARALLAKGLAWDSYWNRVNAEFLGQPIEPLEPLLGRYLLAVRDPVRLARRLHEESGLERDEPVAIAAIASDDDVSRTVHFDPATEELFLVRRDGNRRRVTWEEVRTASGFGARPSGMLEYLLFAAFGSYLVVDPEDGIHPFHETVCRIHERHIGVGFPWVTFTVSGPLAGAGNCFLEIFRPGFAETTVGILSEFFES